MGRKRKSFDEINLDTFLNQRRSKRGSALLKFPDEILEHIIGFITKSQDLKNLSLTCRRLHLLSRKTFSESHEIVLTSKVNKRLLSQTIRTYKTVQFQPKSRFRRVQGKDFIKVIPQLKLIAENVTSMAICDCSEGQFMTVVKMCPKLNELYWYLKASAPIPYTFLQMCFVQNILKMKKVSIIRSHPICRSHRIHRKNNITLNLT